MGSLSTGSRSTEDCCPGRTFFVRSGSTLPYAVDAETVKLVLPQPQLQLAMNRLKEERKKRRYVNTPNGRVDLEGKKMSEEEWIEACNQADPLENYLRKKKEFGESRPRERAIKLLRDGRQHYLLNRSTMGIDRVRYRTRIVSDHSTDKTEAKRFELADLPPESFIGIGPVPGEAQRSRAVQVVDVEWSDGRKTEDLGLLREWSPHSGGTRVSNLDLQYVPRYPKRSGVT